MYKKQFIKKATSTTDQIQILKNRDLAIDDESYAKHCLKTVSFHRLSAYCRPYEQANKSGHYFKPGTTFSHIWNLYAFDRELRLLVLDAIEKIEIAIRTSLSNVMSIMHDPWWYCNKDVFKSEWILKRGKKDSSPSEDFLFELESICNHKNPQEEVKNYYKEYDDPKYPPSWIIIECLSFGRCTSLFRYIRDHKDKSDISAVFKLHYKIFESMLEPLRYTRNLCAHHARLWDRWFVYKPREIIELKKINCIPGTFKEQLAILYILYREISPQSNWKSRLYDLFEKYKELPILFNLTGFNQSWRTDLFWKL